MDDKLQLLRHIVEQTYSLLEPDRVALIETSRNLSAIVDARYATQLDQYRWYAVVSRGDYVSVAGDVDGSRVSMQRLVLSLERNVPVGDIKQVTFANKLTFDCRYENLVAKTGRTSVMRNRKPKQKSTSMYKGVRRKERTCGGQYWAAQIKCQVGQLSLGNYDSEREAALVYDAAAYLLFRESAFYNFPDLVPDAAAVILALDRIQRFEAMKSRKN